MKLIFSERAWEDYLFWQHTDRKILQRINTLIKEIQRTPFEGIGKPEPLKLGHGASLMNIELSIIWICRKITFPIYELLLYCPSW